MNASVAELERIVLNTILECFHSDVSRSIRPVINATGVLLHTNLGRAPLAARAIQRVEQCAAYTNLEMDMVEGRRNKRGERVARLVCELTGAEDAVVVNNCAAATMLVLAGTSYGKEVVVSRGQLVEIGAVSDYQRSLLPQALPFVKLVPQTELICRTTKMPSTWIPRGL